MDLNEIISSLSQDDINKLKEVAATILPSDSAPSNNEVNNIAAQVGKLGSVIGADDEKTALIRALKPMLSVERQKKADEAIKLMGLIRLLPTLRDSGILKNLL